MEYKNPWGESDPLAAIIAKALQKVPAKDAAAAAAAAATASVAEKDAGEEGVDTTTTSSTTSTTTTTASAAAATPPARVEKAKEESKKEESRRHDSKSSSSRSHRHSRSRSRSPSRRLHRSRSRSRSPSSRRRDDRHHRRSRSRSRSRSPRRDSSRRRSRSRSPDRRDRDRGGDRDRDRERRSDRDRRGDRRSRSRSPPRHRDSRTQRSRSRSPPKEKEEEVMEMSYTAAQVADNFLEVFSTLKPGKTEPLDFLLDCFDDKFDMGDLESQDTLPYKRADLKAHLQKHGTWPVSVKKRVFVESNRPTDPTFCLDMYVAGRGPCFSSTELTTAASTRDSYVLYRVRDSKIQAVWVLDDFDGIVSDTTVTEERMYACKAFLCALDLMIRPGGLGGTKIDRHYHNYDNMVTLG